VPETCIFVWQNFLVNLHCHKNCLDRCNNFDLNVCLKLKAPFSPVSPLNGTYLCFTIQFHMTPDFVIFPELCSTYQAAPPLDHGFI
jgi:hypothetical protein